MKTVQTLKHQWGAFILLVAFALAMWMPTSSAEAAGAPGWQNSAVTGGPAQRVSWNSKPN